ncbi:hypothetical protein QQ045_012716 [Rhodiola kirilowii]
MVKNKLKEEYDLPTNLEALNKWTIPKIEPSLIYKLGTFEKMGLKQVVKTTEETIPLDSEELTIRLLDESDLLLYRNSHKFIHIGLVQIAFKPLTLEGLPESFIAALRDGRNLDWKQSLMEIIQTSLAHDQVVPPQSITKNNLIDVIQTPEGSVKFQFEDIARSTTSSRLSRSNSMYSFISPINYKIEQPLESSRASTSQIRDAERIERQIMDHNNIVKGLNTKDPKKPNLKWISIINYD